MKKKCLCLNQLSLDLSDQYFVILLIWCRVQENFSFSVTHIKYIKLNLKNVKTTSDVFTDT